MKIFWVVLSVAPLVAGCALQPDVVWDSGIIPDSGTTDTDAGTDGGVATGSISASLATTTAPSGAPVVWTGTDVAFSQINVSAGQATLRGDSLGAGHFELQLVGLVVGQTGGVWTLISYSTANSAEAWSCSVGNSAACTATVSISSYDGVTITGGFDVQFNSATIGTDMAALSGGSFNITFPLQ
jgi:hypothetical protein